MNPSNSQVRTALDHNVPQGSFRWRRSGWHLTVQKDSQAGTRWQHRHHVEVTLGQPERPWDEGSQEVNAPRHWKTQEGPSAQGSLSLWSSGQCHEVMGWSQGFCCFPEWNGTLQVGCVVWGSKGKNPFYPWRGGSEG